ncbi:Prpf38b [Symbiodinium natans]|uniref:Prpf38b protein n=1 Tax=Symbiodinium natans TaxID=878477 RepID=A0A812RYV7_9DINO|nr:Prpf38b [Symbiodinium natans]
MGNAMGTQCPPWGSQGMRDAYEAMEADDRVEQDVLRDMDPDYEYERLEPADPDQADFFNFVGANANWEMHRGFVWE